MAYDFDSSNSPTTVSINGTTVGKKRKKNLIGEDDTPVAPLENCINYSVRKVLHVHGDPSRAREGHTVSGLLCGNSMASITAI